MTSDIFKSSNVSLVMSWFISIPALIGIVILPYYYIYSILKDKEVNKVFGFWLLICGILLSPIRYNLLQIHIAESYLVQSFSAFFTVFAGIYIVPLFGILFFIGFGLPLACLYAIAGFPIAGFKARCSKFRLIISSLAAPMIFSIFSFLFFLLLPFFSYTIHWVRYKDLIKATNGPSTVLYKYIVEPYNIFLPKPVYVYYIGKDNFTAKERLRAHLSCTYMSKNNCAEYFFVAHPNYAKYAVIDE